MGSRFLVLVEKPIALMVGQGRRSGLRPTWESSHECSAVGDVGRMKWKKRVKGRRGLIGRGGDDVKTPIRCLAAASRFLISIVIR
jgi:hypothetical protein